MLLDPPYAKSRLANITQLRGARIRLGMLVLRLRLWTPEEISNFGILETKTYGIVGDGTCVSL